VCVANSRKKRQAQRGDFGLGFPRSVFLPEYPSFCFVRARFFLGAKPAVHFLPWIDGFISAGYSSPSICAMQLCFHSLSNFFFFLFTKKWTILVLELVVLPPFLFDHLEKSWLASYSAQWFLFEVCGYTEDQS
jgi:hypothetical protein